MAGLLNVFGLVTALFGVLLLFRYGIPYRASAAGDIIIARPTPEDTRLGRRYKALGYLGLFLIVIGTIAQLIPNWSQAVIDVQRLLGS